MCMHLIGELQICEVKAERTLRRNHQVHNYSWGFQYSSVTDRINRKNISKDIENLNYIIHWIDLIDFHTTFYPMRAEYTSFSITHRIFTKKAHIWGHKNSHKFENSNHTKDVLC